VEVLTSPSQSPAHSSQDRANRRPLGTLAEPPLPVTLAAELPAIEAQPIPPPESSSPSPWAFWKICATTFATIFLAEMGDKTQVSTLLMSAESHAPWVVFTGAATALISTSLIGVLVGRWLCTRLSPRTLDTAAGITLALIALWLFWDVAQISG